MTVEQCLFLLHKAPNLVLVGIQIVGDFVQRSTYLLHRDLGPLCLLSAVRIALGLGVLGVDLLLLIALRVVRLIPIMNVGVIVLV